MAKAPRRQPTIRELREDAFIAASLAGVLAAHEEEPDPEYVCNYALSMGRRVALAVEKRRRPKGRKPAK